MKIDPLQYSRRMAVRDSVVSPTRPSLARRAQALAESRTVIQIGTRVRPRSEQSCLVPLIQLEESNDKVGTIAGIDDHGLLPIGHKSH